VEPGTEDPWGGHAPWLQRRGPRVALALLAAASFLALTLMSTCSARTGPSPTTTTTLQVAAGEARRSAPGLR
jgi:hypothetical protein